MKKLIFLIILPLFFSCSKDWLDKKPDGSLVVPESIDDAQALLDDSDVMNKTVAYGELACDDYYITDDFWAILSSSVEKNGYIWAKDIYNGEGGYDWYGQYNKILTCNIALEITSKINPSAQNQLSWNLAKGSALFVRAFSFLQLAQIFSPPFNTGSATSDLGIPLRLSTNVEEKSTRASLKETYDQILKDLLSAADLLPLTVTVKTRPSKAAAYALLSRIYLELGDYPKGLEYANKCLELYSKVIDYNSVPINSPTTFARFNDEVIYDAFLSTYAYQSPSFNAVDTMFYRSYSMNDIRKDALFSTKGAKDHVFKGSYGGPSGLAGILWGGLATDEIFLIKSECLARTGQIPDAMAALNQLLEKRYQKASFIPFTATMETVALSIILSERRKELPFRGIRFNDLRRLNKDSRFARTLQRKLNGQIYELPPNDKRYVYPIPDNIINKTGMQQNER